MAISAFSVQKKDKLEQIFDIILHEGLLTYNPKSSKSSISKQLLARVNDKHHKKGAIFVVRKKSDFTDSGVKGYIISSKETVIEQAGKLTHFTPNIYRRYRYADQDRRYVKGFIEENLQQVNTFVVDIDTKEHTVQEILLACIDESIGQPTLIVSSDRGYQVFFMLETPIYISNKNEFRSLKVAKRIAENLKRSLKSVDADQYCNDFGFFRIPNHQNVEWFDETAVYTPASLIAWSQRRDNDMGRSLYVVPQKMQVTSLTQSEWFNHLLHATDVKGEKGQIGRNNVLFTLALVCFQDGKDQSFTFDLLDEYNANLRHPLSSQEIKTIVASAYSGKYKGAKKEYVEQLLALYVQGAEGVSVHFGHKGWYKHKKAREDRERSHCHEWEQDIADWIAAEKSVSEPFIWRTQKELCEEIGIAGSTLNKLLKQSKKVIKTTTGKGRNAKTGWSTVELYIEYIIWLKKDLGARFAQSVRLIVGEQMELFERVAGYTTLLNYVKKMMQERPLTEQLSMEDILQHTG
ncbi:primase C-terminal domain-containing protein [Lysinibacillus odysseyi]|uniref:primase C-terminal domain-containing protein n=1 Tax=Lysinibacillus odysseyi TaxID=202611 RepID=UPI00068D18E4|nr:primase C-terminal domain-containing protein [Lysinibacillus odysseyi]